jgi:hypothetical protein
MRTVAVAAGGAVLVLAGAAAILFLWLRGYAPLEARGAYAPGPRLAADVEPVTGSGGKPVFVPAYRRPGETFDTAFTVHNSGRFAVTLLGFEPDAGTSRPAAAGLFRTDAPNPVPGRLHPFRRLRLDPDDTATVVVRWRLDCSTEKTSTFSDAVRLRYRYLSLFTRTERIRLPFAVTLRCAGGPRSP